MIPKTKRKSAPPVKVKNESRTGRRGKSDSSAENKSSVKSNARKNPRKAEFGRKKLLGKKRKGL